MPNNNNIDTQRKQYINAFFLLAALVCLIYSNTLDASWHFDDGPNILSNDHLHLTDLRLTSLANTLISGSDRSNPTFYRPVACFTLALNWYFGQDDTTGYHIVNIAIHIITAFFLFLVLLQIMRQVNATDDEAGPKNYFIALLAAALWAASPIQTQAVTYIVQRMASLAAMFTILALYSYLKARTEKKYIRWVTLCILCYAAGVGSKENAVMLPASLLLLEVSFFTFIHLISKQKVIRILIAASFVLLAGFSCTYFGLNSITLLNPSELLDSYATRSFTITERILTEPRILLLYLSQIFFPLVSRLSLVHNINLSTSLVTPWTTLPAIITIFTLIALSIIFLKKYPLFTFPVLFFFLNHMVESTILPLELIFEHRNYLPSFFLFLPTSFLVAQALYPPGRLSPVGRFAIISGTICFLILFGHASYTRNFVWATEGTLWTDGLQKAPLSPRAAGYLGKWYQKNGHKEKAYNLFRHALQNSHLAPTPKTSRLAAIKALEEIHSDSGQHNEAVSYLNQCLEIEKNDERCLTKRAMSYLNLGLAQAALNDAKNLLKKHPNSSTYRYIAASATYRTGDLAAAQKHMKKALRKSLNKPDGLYLMGIILLKYQRYPNSLFFLRRAANLSPNTAKFQLTLAAAYYTNHQLDAAEKILHNIFTRHPLPVIKKALQNSEHDTSSKEAVNFLKNTLTGMINELSGHYDEIPSQLQ